MSLKRLSKFLQLEELDPRGVDWQEELDAGWYRPRVVHVCVCLCVYVHMCECTCVCGCT